MVLPQPFLLHFTSIQKPSTPTADYINNTESSKLLHNINWISRLKRTKNEKRENKWMNIIYTKTVKNQFQYMSPPINSYVYEGDNKEEPTSTRYASTKDLVFGEKTKGSK